MIRYRDFKLERIAKKLKSGKCLPLRAGNKKATQSDLGGLILLNLACYASFNQGVVLT